MCVRACVRACVRTCVRACVCVCERERRVTGSHPLYIGAYYKPHEDALTSLTELRKSIEQVGKKNGNIWLLGNFNLP